MSVLRDPELKKLLLGLQHVGFVVDDLDQALTQWQRLYGLDPASIRRLPPAGADLSQVPARFALFSLAGQEIELIEPRGEPYLGLMRALKSGQAGINHLAWRVSDIEAALNTLAKLGVTPGYVTPAGTVQFGNKKLVYLDPATTDGHLIELIEIADA